MVIFADDLEYWGIGEIYLDICCLNKFTSCKEAIMEEIKKELLNIKKEEPLNEFPKTRCGYYMRVLWVGINLCSVWLSFAQSVAWFWPVIVQILWIFWIRLKIDFLKDNFVHCT